MGRNRLSQTTRLAPRTRLSLRLMLECVVPVSMALIGFSLTFIEPGEVEVRFFEDENYIELIIQEGKEGFMP